MTPEEEAAAIAQEIERKKAARARSMANLRPPIRPGECLNPGGKPKNARNRLQGNFLNALADDFDKHGREAIARARLSDPMGYVRAIVALMPRQMEQTTPLEEMSDAELTAGIALLRSRLAVGVIEGKRAPAIAEQVAGLQALPEASRISRSRKNLS